MSTPIFLAVTGKDVCRAEQIDGQWQIERSLTGVHINCLDGDPRQPQRVYAGTQSDGVLASSDGGRTWQPCGLEGATVKSLAVSPHTPGTIYAGCRPISLYVSRDGGANWEELEAMRRVKRWWWFSPADPPDWRPYIQALAISPMDPNVILAGIEVGGVIRSQDGGRTWSGPLRGALLDCHSLLFHPVNRNWIYEGGGGGAAVSQDGGRTWRKPRDGLSKTYGWMVAADPARPEVWYLSAAPMPNLLRGEFTPRAHKDGHANASIFRSVGGASWEALSGGLPDPLDYMPYSLLTVSGTSGLLYAGLSNGQVWLTQDYGDNWEQLPFQLDGIYNSMILVRAK